MSDPVKWTQRVPSKPGAYWRRRLCPCGHNFLPVEVVHLEKSKTVSGTLAVADGRGTGMGAVVVVAPDQQWIHEAVDLPVGTVVDLG